MADDSSSFIADSSAAIYLDEQPLTQSALQPEVRLVDIERIEAGRLPMEIEPHPASELVERCLREMSGLAHSSGVVLRAGEVRGSALADVDRIVQALTNLVGNAVKFSPRGGVVTVAAAPDPAHPDRSVLFSVADQGRGIPEDKLEAVFHPFEQVDSSDSREHGGTGLGLAITRRIIDQRSGHCRCRRRNLICHKKRARP